MRTNYKFSKCLHVSERIGGYNETLIAGEDMDLFRRMTKIGKTRCDVALVLHHTGRRAHKIGWPRLLTLWFMNNLSAIFLKRSISKEWVEIR